MPWGNERQAWKRDDWVNKKTGKTALQLAQETFQRGACTRLYEIPAG
jgi:hypothetical protein